jgi:hypothetical protein
MIFQAGSSNDAVDAPGGSEEAEVPAAVLVGQGR